MSADRREDRDLIAAHLAGDREAFGELVARHRDRLHAVALRTAGTPDLAADALQDGLIAAFRRAGSYRGDAAVTTWLHRIVVNAALDLHRRNAVRAADPLPEDDRGLHRDLHLDPHRDRGPRTGVSPAPPADPADTAVRSDQQRRIVEALRTLPADQRAALVLVDVEGWSIAEAAEVLECPPGTIKSRCSRGRARLAELLREPAAGERAGEASDTSALGNHRTSPHVRRAEDPASTERMVPRET